MRRSCKIIICMYLIFRHNSYTLLNFRCFHRRQVPSSAGQLSCVLRPGTAPLRNLTPQQWHRLETNPSLLPSKYDTLTFADWFTGGIQKREGGLGGHLVPAYEDANGTVRRLEDFEASVSRREVPAKSQLSQNFCQNKSRFSSN